MVSFDFFPFIFDNVVDDDDAIYRKGLLLLIFFVLLGSFGENRNERERGWLHMETYIYVLLLFIIIVSGSSG